MAQKICSNFREDLKNQLIIIPDRQPETLGVFTHHSKVQKKNNTFAITKATLVAI